MRRTFTLQMYERPWLYWREACQALEVACWLCEAPAGHNCPDDPDDPEIVYQWPPLAPSYAIFHESRVLEDDPR